MGSSAMLDMEEGRPSARLVDMEEGLPTTGCAARDSALARTSCDDPLGRISQEGRPLATCQEVWNKAQKWWDKRRVLIHF